MKSGIPPRAPSGGPPKARKQQTAHMQRVGTGKPPVGGLTSNASKAGFKRFNENDYTQPGLDRKQSNRLLGNR